MIQNDSKSTNLLIYRARENIFLMVAMHVRIIKHLHMENTSASARNSLMALPCVVSSHHIPPPSGDVLNWEGHDSLKQRDRTQNS